MSKKNKLIPRNQDFNDWYNSVVKMADLADYARCAAR